MNSNESKKKKIMFLITGSDVGGAEIVVRNLIFNLDVNRFLPILVSIRPLGKIGKEIGDKFPAFSLGAKEKFNPFFIWRLYILLKQHKPDILHCHLFHANLLGRIVGRLSGVKFIISTVHSDNFGGKLRYFLLRISDRLNNVTVAVSENVKNSLIEKKVSSQDKIKVIYNGVPAAKEMAKQEVLNLKEELGLTENYPVILSVGRLHPVKGHIYLVRAMKMIVDKFPKAKLILIGDGSERVSLEKEASNLGVAGSILFMGGIRAEDIHYRIADIFVLPSLVEGFGLTVVEAMKNRTLVVASGVGGVSEIVQDKENGFIIESKNNYNLGFKIISTISLSGAEKNKIKNRAKQGALNSFSLYKMLERYSQLYN